ncbi:MAG: hypothetical protein WC773_03555 [Patescibacteria group bacterium]|jgi:hypothetical protein
MNEYISGESEVGQSGVKPRISADLIVSRICDERWSPEGIAQYRAETEKSVQRYRDIELNLPITDEPMKRICQVLTNNGLITVESCEGHGEELPVIWFACDDKQLLKDIIEVVYRRTVHKKFPWLIEVYSANTSMDMPIYYILSPSQAKGIIDPKDDREELLTDLDIIGESVMKYFHQINSEDEAGVS